MVFVFLIKYINYEKSLKALLPFSQGNTSLIYSTTCPSRLVGHTCKENCPETRSCTETGINFDQDPRTCPCPTIPLHVFTLRNRGRKITRHVFRKLYKQLAISPSYSLTLRSSLKQNKTEYNSALLHTLKLQWLSHLIGVTVGF